MKSTRVKKDMLIRLRGAESGVLTSIPALQAADLGETNHVADVLNVMVASPLCEMIQELENMIAGEEAEADSRAA